MMKTITATLLAAALCATGLSAPALAQPSKPTHEQSKSHQQPSNKTNRTSAKATSKQTYKTFRKGEKFDQRHAKNYQVVDYRKYKRLSPPRRGYRYVRAGNDILLIGTTTFKVYAVYSGLIG